MRKIKPYLLPLAILIGGSLLIIISVYQNLDFVYNKDKSIALMISGFGLVFAAFQLTLNNNLQSIRNVTALRHAVYKEFIKFLNSISGTIIDSMMIDDMKVESLFSSLLNKQNEFSSFIKTNNTYLFKEIDKNKIVDETFDTVVKLVVRTDKYRYERQKVKNMDEIYWMQRHMQWHNEMNAILKDYHRLRHEAARELQKYILH